MAFSRRTHTCGELRESHVGQTVTLNGWVNTYRAQQHQVFVDLRDRYGLTQVVFEPRPTPSCSPPPTRCAREWVLSRHRQGAPRLPGKHNPKLATGDIEVEVQRLHVLNRCPTPPFEVLVRPAERTRHARRPRAGQRGPAAAVPLPRPAPADAPAHAEMRHRLNKVIRDYLDAQGFLELETPLLGRSTPEGAATTSCPAACSTASSTPCRSRRSCTSNC